MKKLILLAFLGSFYASALASAPQAIGQFLNDANEQISVYPRPAKVKFGNSIRSGCDCQFEKYTFYYFDAEGKHHKIKEAKILELTLNAGTVMCKKQAPVLVGRDEARPQDIHYERADLETDLPFLPLPKYKKKKKNFLHKVVAQNADYLLTSHVPDNSNEGVFYIFSRRNKQMVEGPMRTLLLGEGKRGAALYEKIERYFPDCPALYEKMEANRKHQNNLRKVGVVHLLSKINGCDCGQ
ncbi:MAG: hypothetical protein AAFW73_16590 [Bacteroidota bacterium]